MMKTPITLFVLGCVLSLPVMTKANTCRECECTFWPREGENGRVCRSCLHKKNTAVGLGLLAAAAQEAKSEREQEYRRQQNRRQNFEDQLFVWQINLPGSEWQWHVVPYPYNAKTDVVGAITSNCEWVTGDGSEKATRPTSLMKYWYSGKNWLGLMRYTPGKRFYLLVRDKNKKTIYQSPVFYFVQKGAKDNKVNLDFKYKNGKLYLSASTFDNKKFSSSEDGEVSECTIYFFKNRICSIASDD